MIFVPTSRESYSPLSMRVVTKGQLYNLDTNEYFSFQFNPETFEYTRDLNWIPQTFNGDETGGDLFYINSGPRTFELPLLFIVDPSAPEIQYSTPDYNAPGVTKPPRLTGGTMIDFEQLTNLIEKWCAKIPEKGRPARIRVIFGRQYFDGVITNLTVRKSSFFEDLTVREGTFILRFREWLIKRAA